MSASCAIFVAPKITDVTPGWVTSQLMATCAGGLPIFFETSISTSCTRQLCSVNLLKIGFGMVSRPSPLPPVASRLYLPVRRPPARGLQGQMPMPSSCAAGMCSRSILRSESEYSSCSVAQRSSPPVFGEGLRAGEIPCGRVGQTVVANFSFANEIGERGDDFLDGRDHVPGVEIVEIDVIGVEAAQRRFERGVNIFAAVAAGVRISRLRAESEFRGDDGLVAKFALGDKFADDLLALSHLVAVGGVDEVAAVLDVEVEHFEGELFVGAPAPSGAETHSAEAQRADAQAGASQRGVVIQFHMIPPKGYPMRAASGEIREGDSKTENRKWKIHDAGASRPLKNRCTGPLICVSLLWGGHRLFSMAYV